MIEWKDFLDLTLLHAEYAAAVDGGHWDSWPEFFTDECIYKIQPRENYERGFPLATLSFESKGMLRDRVYSIKETLFHDPYYQRHIVSAPRVLSVAGEELTCEANYAVFRTKPNGLSSVFNVGRYLDIVRRTPQGLKFASRLCIYDSEMIPNSIIYPL